MDILEPIEWKDEWTLGDDATDRQHKQIIKLFNRFVDSLEAPIEVRQSEIRNAISTLVIYYEIHNRSEENLMRKIDYPKDLIDNHIRGHEKVNMDILSLVEFFNANQEVGLNMPWLKGVIRSWTPFIPLSQDDIDLIKYVKANSL